MITCKIAPKRKFDLVSNTGNITTVKASFLFIERQNVLNSATKGYHIEKKVLSETVRMNYRLIKLNGFSVTKGESDSYTAERVLETAIWRRLWVEACMKGRKYASTIALVN